MTLIASMRPPVLPSGNADSAAACGPAARRFNEAAGFTQRKRRWRNRQARSQCPGFNEAAGFTQRKRPAAGTPATELQASMRPPVLPSGNPCWQ